MTLCYDISLNDHPGSHNSEGREGGRLAIKIQNLVGATLKQQEPPPFPPPRLPFALPFLVFNAASE